jgi:hypothetical protein
MWAPFYHAGPDIPDDKDPPHFRVSAEVFGRAKDDNRRISKELNVQLISNTTKVAETIAEARKVITERQQVHMQQHEDLIGQTQDALAALSQVFRVAVEKQVELLRESTTSNQALEADMKVAQITKHKSGRRSCP